MGKSQIRKLEYQFFENFGKNYLTVNYTRNGEYNKITYVIVGKFNRSERSVRKFINK